jgi:5S rRNA maturation endonuclease (ribonuclease M5)
VGSWASLKVGGQDLFHWKSEVDPTFLFLFTRDDVTHTPIKDLDDGPYATPKLILTATAKVLADRLDALGIAAAYLDGCLEHAVHGEIEQLELWGSETWGAENVEVITTELRGMTFDKWVKRVKFALPTHEPSEHAWRDYTKLQPLMELWSSFDARWLLRALLEAIDPDDEVLLDLTDLELGGYMKARDFDPQTAATIMFSRMLLNETPAIVITEGNNDVEFLQAAIEIRRPHLANFIRFYDFGSVPGGASVALSTVKSLAAACVNNRVIVLLDNDTAAREARRSLRGVQLPNHYVVDHYPEIEMAMSYPSTGPTGRHTGNVNGLAGSVELYLGADVLTDPATGNLHPVVWRTHIPALNAYQGEVANKGAVHDAFRAKVFAARQNPTLVATQDWSGLDAILSRLMDLLRTCGVPDPHNANGSL